MIWERMRGGWRAAIAVYFVFITVWSAAAQVRQPAASAQPAFLGVELRDLTRQEAVRLGQNVPHGTAIKSVEANSPAAAAGLKRGDIMVEIDGHPVTGTAQFLKFIASKRPGTTVKVRLLRHGRLRAGPVRLGVKPEEPAGTAALPVPEPIPQKQQVAAASKEEDLATLDAQMRQLDRQGKYAEALPLAERYVSLARQRHGEQHPSFAAAISWQGNLYKDLGRYGEAEPLLKQALEMRERLLGGESPDTLASVNNLAELYQAQGRYAEAEPLYSRALEARQRVLGREHPDTLTSVSDLAVLYKAQGRYGAAELVFPRLLEARERVLGKDHPDTLRSVSALADLYRLQGRYAEAEPLFRRALDGWEHAFGKEHPDTLANVNSLAHLYYAQGRYGEAEPLFRRALDGCEHLFGEEHPNTLTAVNNLAELYRAEGRYGEAEPLLRRVIEGDERVLGKDHPNTLRIVSNLAELYGVEHRYGDALPLFRRALEGEERVLGKDHPLTLVNVNNLAALYDTLGAYGQAEPLHRRVLEARERVLGKDHPLTLASVNNLATLYLRQDRYSDAEPLFRRALESDERVLGREHPDTLKIASNLAMLYYKQRDWARAVEFWRRSTLGIATRTLRGIQDGGQALTGKKKSEAERASTEFSALVRAAYRLAPEGGAPDAGLTREMFQTAQWALSSEAAQSLAQMAARGAAGDPKLAALVRERQDLVTEWQQREVLHNTAVARAPDKRDAKAEAANLARQAEIGGRIEEIGKRLAAEFPDYASFASPAPLAVAEVQSLLHGDEALVQFLDMPEFKPVPEETFIWVVTKDDVRWVRSDLGTPALAREVQALRCGLDGENWTDAAPAKRCTELIGHGYKAADYLSGKPLPFDLARAHELYQALFGQVGDLIKGKQLLLVPSGPLTQLPFQVLVTAPPANADDKSAAWLIRDHALTVLPAVSSLKALRRIGRPSAATKPMIGFGDPLLDGDPADAGDRRRAREARDSQRCPVPRRIASNERSYRGVAPLATGGGLASVADIRFQAPLPETAGELCDVARDVHADADAIYLGARATEREVKHLSETGQLAQYRIVHFATHGALAGQVTGNSEPGLLLTPPSVASELDDGYLTASEIAALKLDADWVILSACNTAAGDAGDAQALSGPARAFIYAQARALLVSHWEVNSDAAVKLITGAMSRLAAGKSMGRAEAMRQSMLALIDDGQPQEAQPAIWAPFVVVGEGAR